MADWVENNKRSWKIELYTKNLKKPNIKVNEEGISALSIFAIIQLNMRRRQIFENVYIHKYTIMYTMYIQS